jgi:hypothetical protein
MKTQAQDSVAGVTRHVDAAAAGYRRHQRAYKQLRGPDPQGWQQTYRRLSATDVRGLSKKAIYDTKLEDRYRAKCLAEALATVIRSSKPSANGNAMEVDNTLPSQGHSHARAVPGNTHAAEVDNDSDGEDDEETFKAEVEQADDVADIAEACRLAGAEGVGEGKRKLSWIWVVGLKFENLKDNRLLDGT